MNCKKICMILFLLTMPVLAASPAFASLKNQDISEAEETFVTEADIEASAVSSIEAGIASIDKYGNIHLTISPQSMEELGYEPADKILVQIGSEAMEMPIGTSYTDVDSGEPICCFKENSKTGAFEVILAVNGGSMADQMNVACIESIDENPGYKVVWKDGMDASVPVILSMSEKQGYAEEYQLHQLGSSRSNNREDYPHLTDAEFANFRAVNTTGMGRDTLLRSSSPVNPVYNRNAAADQAMSDACVKTVFNMADNEDGMTSYPDYGMTYYSGCDITAQNMGMDFSSEDFRSQLAEGFRFFATHEGPYLIHCSEGKDRAGFGAAVLECLMGASLDEVIADYMVTFYNFYGIEPDSAQYVQIWHSNILKSLSSAFGVDLEAQKTADLAACAESYLEEIGMSPEEIDALKANLSVDYGGLEQ